MDAPQWPGPEGYGGWRVSIGQVWQWRRVGLLDEDMQWLEKMLAPAHEGHPIPDPCWITYEYLGRRGKIRSW